MSTRSQPSSSTSPVQVQVQVSVLNKSSPDVPDPIHRSYRSVSEKENESTWRTPSQSYKGSQASQTQAQTQSDWPALRRPKANGPDGTARGCERRIDDLNSSMKYMNASVKDLNASIKDTSKRDRSYVDRSYTDRSYGSVGVSSSGSGGGGGGESSKGESRTQSVARLLSFNNPKKGTPTEKELALQQQHDEWERVDAERGDGSDGEKNEEALGTVKVIVAWGQMYDEKNNSGDSSVKLTFNRKKKETQVSRGKLPPSWGETFRFNTTRSTREKYMRVDFRTSSASGIGYVDDISDFTLHWEKVVTVGIYPYAYPGGRVAGAAKPDPARAPIGEVTLQLYSDLPRTEGYSTPLPWEGGEEEVDGTVKIIVGWGQVLDQSKKRGDPSVRLVFNGKKNETKVSQKNPPSWGEVFRYNITRSTPEKNMRVEFLQSGTLLGVGNVDNINDFALNWEKVVTVPIYERWPVDTSLPDKERKPIAEVTLQLYADLLRAEGYATPMGLSQRADK